MLSDLLAENADLKTALASALQIITEIYQRSGGILLVQSASDPVPILIISHQVPESLAGQLGDEESPLRRLCQQVRLLQAEKNALIQPDPDSGLAAAVPVCAGSGCQGVLLLCGTELTEAETRSLAWLARVISRTIQANRSFQALGKGKKELVSPERVGEQADDKLEVNRWQLLRSRNTLRALFDNLPASIYIVDPRYQLIALNMTRAMLANSKPNALVGQRCYEALYQRQEICQACRVMETFAGGHNTNRTRREWAEDGEPLEWEIDTYPIRDEQGEVIQAILLEQDVTDKRRLEATLAQSEKLAAVGQLAAGVAHEINNPLTAILANAQMLQRELPADDDRQELVELITKAGNRATQVVRNLLDFARKEQYEYIPVDLNETIDGALALLQHTIVSRSIHLVFEAGEDLPMVLASPDHLQGVWLNLLVNAIDALDEHEGEIRITTRQTGSEVRVTVADTGNGIPPERLSRIFEPFYTTKAPGRGTGLGLSVSHRIVKQHGGQILVTSQVGKGTEFSVVLPVTYTYPG